MVMPIAHGHADGSVDAGADAIQSDHGDGHGDAGDRVDSDADADCVDAVGGDGDGAGDGGDIKGGNWWDPCTFDYHHGHLGESHFSYGIILHLFHIYP